MNPENDPKKPKTGTPYYMAPELFQEGGVYSF
jgi:serine/threonine protein kinase